MGTERASAKQSIFPINQLPREILARIFWHCVPLAEGTDLPILMSRHEAPLLLCRVCSSWRELALATPNIWTIVGIIIRNPDADPSAISHVINIWLERSGALPLTLYLGHLRLLYVVPRSQTRPVLIEAVLSVFYSHSSRWKDVTFVLYESPQLLFPGLGQWKYPLLRALRLHGPWPKPIRQPLDKTPHFAQLSRPYALDVSTSPQISWTRIFYLDMLPEMTCFGAARMIRLCPQLEEFSVNLFLDRAIAAVVDKHIPRVENHCLQKLSISVKRDCSFFLDSLTLPALTEFAFAFDGADDEAIPFTHPSLLDFFTRSKCKIKKLKLSGCRFIASTFLECLAHESLETVQALSITYDPKLSDDVLIRLTDLPSPPAPRVLLPKLTHLVLKMCLAASPGMLGRMVLSRHCLRAQEHEAERLEFLDVRVELGDELSEADDNAIEDAAAEGLVASILNDWW